MNKISSYIFALSPKKLAIYLILGPLLLFLAHTVISVALRNISETSAFFETPAYILLGALFLPLLALILLWLFWLRSVVYSVNAAQTGLSLKWFQIAFTMVCVFIFYAIATSIIESLSSTHIWLDDYMHWIYASREFVHFAGIMIAYPIVCHYGARAIYTKINTEPATVVNSLLYTLMLVFGTVIAIPFLHKYFSTKTTEKSKIILIYAVAFGLIILLFILGFIAAITGLV